MFARPELRVIVTASLAGLLFGFDTAVVSGVTQALRDTFALSPVGLGLAVSSALWGTLLGAAALGQPGDRFGSRDVLKFVGLLYLASSLGSAFAWNFPTLLLCRFLTGIAIGGSSILAPVYITEVAPARRRGTLVGLFQVNIVVGILVAYISNFMLDEIVGGSAVWRWKLAIPAIPALGFLLLLFLIPQSPRWLASRRRFDEAKRSLAALGVTDPAGRLEEWKVSAPSSGDGPSAALSGRRHRKPILLAIGLGLFNQQSGINAILYYLRDIFDAAGFNSLSSNLQSVAIGATNLLATMLALTLIDRVGRKRLLLIGSIGMALALGGVSLIMRLGSGRGLLLPLLVLFIGSFAISQGAVIWVYLSEIFPTAVRARGQSLGSMTHWVTNAVISALFPYIAAASSSLPFLFFSAMMILQFLIVLRYFPETKGMSLEQLDHMLGQTTEDEGLQGEVRW